MISHIVVQVYCEHSQVAKLWTFERPMYEMIRAQVDFDTREAAKAMGCPLQVILLEPDLFEAG